MTIWHRILIATSSCKDGNIFSCLIHCCVSGDLKIYHYPFHVSSYSEANASISSRWWSLKEAMHGRYKNQSSSSSFNILSAGHFLYRSRHWRSLYLGCICVHVTDWPSSQISMYWLVKQLKEHNCTIVEVRVMRYWRHICKYESKQTIEFNAQEKTWQNLKRTV